MGSETVNKLKDSEIHGDFIGRDKITNIIMFQKSEREFVVTHNANIKPVSYFTGRETELKELRQRIEEGRKSVLVSGMGGIGKTHICRKLFEEYLNKHAIDENGPFQHIGYIEYSGDMGNSLQNCLKFRQQDAPEQNQEAAWQELEYLASHGKLLLFVDNVDKPISVDLGLQRLKGIPGAVVLTSRQTSFSDEFEPYPIGFLGTEQCKEIYEKIRFGGSVRKVEPEEVPDLEYVIESLAGRHTITVELLAHLARTKLWPVIKLREKLEEKGFQLQFHKNGELVNIQKSYEVLYDLSKLTAAEQNILEAFSIFPYIPLAAEICNEWLLEDAGASEDDDILMGLYEKGWLQFDEEQEGYALHPVFAQFIYEKCRPTMEKHLGLIEACQEHLEVPESGSALECQKHIPIAENILEKLDDEKWIKPIGLIFELSVLLQYIAEYKKAEKWYKEFLKIYEELGGENCSITVTAYNNLANVFESQGDYAKAQELLENGLRIFEKEQFEDYLNVATIYNNLAEVYAKQGDYAKAKAMHEKSFKIKKKMLNEDHPDIATSYNNLAGIYAGQEDFDKAMVLYEKSINNLERVVGENNLEVAQTYNNLAWIYGEQGNFEKAEMLYKKSLNTLKGLFGEKHPDIATCYNNLGYLYKNQGEYVKAEEFYKESIRIREEMLGKNHPATAICYNNIAVAYDVQGKYQRALTYYCKAYKTFFFRCWLSYPKTQKTYDNMVTAYYKWDPKGNFEQWLEKQMKETE